MSRNFVYILPSYHYSFNKQVRMYIDCFQHSTWRKNLLFNWNVRYRQVKKKSISLIPLFYFWQLKVFVSWCASKFAHKLHSHAFCFLPDQDNDFGMCFNKIYGQRKCPILVKSFMECLHFGTHIWATYIFKIQYPYILTK